MRARARVVSIVLGIGAVVMVVSVGSPPAKAYTRWSINDDNTNCRQCHGDFRSNNYISPVDGENWGNLHDLHRSTMLNGDCDTCHLSSGFFPVLMDDSAGGEGFESVGCIGCHGVDPDPTNPDDAWGSGLRLHHLNAGVPPDGNGQTCLSCHPNDPTPAAENILPSYYFTPDPNHPNKPTDPCNPLPELPENFAGLTLALDNDGDLDADMADADCGTDIIFEDGFESGDTSAWSSVTP